MSHQWSHPTLFRIFLLVLVVFLVVAPYQNTTASPFTSRSAELGSTGGKPPSANQATPDEVAALNTPLTKFQSFLIHGGYATAGVGMRNRGSGTIVLGNIPLNARVVSAYLYWDILADTSMAEYSQGSINGQQVTGDLIGTGPTPCWEATTNFAYRADVTTVVNGNGEYYLSNFASGIRSGIDPWAGNPPVQVVPMLEGASLVVVYEHSAEPFTHVQLYDGSFETDGSNGLVGSLTLNGFTASSPVTHAQTTFIGADGQDANDVDSTFNGTALPTVRWDGSDSVNGTSYSQGNLWDTSTVDVQTLVAPGSTVATATVQGGEDCIVWIAQVFSVSANPPPTNTPTPTPSIPRLFLSPSATTIGLNQFFQLDLKFDTAGQVADTVDGYMTFDPAVLEVVDAAGNPATSITPNSAVVGSVSYNRVDAAAGQIDFSASQYDSPYLSGTATVATIRFRAKAPTSSTQVQLIRNGLRQSDLFLAGVRLNAMLGHATVQITDGALICGRIAVEQRGPAGTPRWITPLFRTEGSTTTGGVTLYRPGTSTEVARFAVTTDADGRFCVTASGVPAGIYDVRVKGANTLSNQRANVDLRTATEISYGTLLVGDSSGDDGVTGADVSYIIPSLWLKAGDAGFRPYADTNRDDEITGADVSALIPNFLRGGPIAVTGAAKPEPQESRVQSGTPPQVTLSPARQKVQVGEVVPIEVKVELGTTPADTVDLHVNINPALLEIVDAAGQPVRSLNVNRSAFADVTYNRVDTDKGQISLSASRLTAPAATGTLTVATFYVRAKQRFTAAALTIATSGTRRADVFARGQSLQPTLTGSVLTMSDLHRLYIPLASQ